jgi:hypothetical protein
MAFYKFSVFLWFFKTVVEATISLLLFRIFYNTVVKFAFIFFKNHILKPF